MICYLYWIEIEDSSFHGSSSFMKIFKINRHFTGLYRTETWFFSLSDSFKPLFEHYFQANLGEDELGFIITRRMTLRCRVIRSQVFRCIRILPLIPLPPPQHQDSPTPTTPYRQPPLFQQGGFRSLQIKGESSTYLRGLQGPLHSQTFFDILFFIYLSLLLGLPGATEVVGGGGSGGSRGGV